MLASARRERRRLPLHLWHRQGGLRQASSDKIAGVCTGQAMAAMQLSGVEDHLRVDWDLLFVASVFKGWDIF